MLRGLKLLASKPLTTRTADAHMGVLVLKLLVSIPLAFGCCPFMVLPIWILGDPRLSRGVDLTGIGILLAFAGAYLCALIPWTIGAPLRWVFPSMRGKVDVTSRREKRARCIGCLNLLVPLIIYLGFLILWNGLPFGK